ncbi:MULTISPECIES: 50S ribosomal protein L11 methyltransferase [Clostridium]|uniref:Ribosomal protein L11 methyltransferase n=1 Tax=Clostridium cadaveris TaxID=1529 RepID=A0A1I2JF98_9CLOT|nr:50S ribosomal protein L11 methyltransferase [Clostridium cadaveris]MDU4951299.1 50S ribosomal protein L11 methyltransferase [Clostridium sp.]MDM8310742.1 50S ribosomal protein L11 methyltransferase [Clostridium cadaveris]MDY4949699.1 50S ribosomal protein L11 methyltransferase [Clostridium cadaveris]NME63857.1 50S ribosomal protein L11 methyltransferase [Clostridium cadaveris]NWK10464.1 50S ribosomal protein L11 methyltransferase [Clostridium cadaveris]
MNGTWIEVKVVTKPDALEMVQGIFYGLDVKGVAIEDPRDILEREQGPLTWDFADINILEHGGKAAVVKGYFSVEDDMEEILEYIKVKLIEIKDMGVDIGEGTVEYIKVNEEDWANNWKKYYKPTKIGKNIIVKPIWEEYEANGEMIIELDPGMAFGTGTHETTRMCVEALEENVKGDTTVFDIGTGSGILAIAAAKLGAKKVIGVDLDPVAVDSAKENVSFNDLNNIEILYGNLMDVVTGKADLVVANIIAEIIVVLAEDVKNFLVPGGLFITSGIIRERRELVETKLKEKGFKIKEVKEQGEWLCIIAEA